MKINVIIKIVLVAFAIVWHASGQAGQNSIVVGRMTPTQKAARQTQMEEQLKVLTPPIVGSSSAAPKKGIWKAATVAGLADGGSQASPHGQIPIASSYSAIDLGSSGGLSASALALNNKGEVAGSMQAGEYGQAFLYSGGVMKNIAIFGDSDIDQSTSTGINESGQVVGYAHTTGGKQYPFLYSNGVFQKMPVLPISYFGNAYDINNGGQAVGFDTDIYSPGPIQPGFTYAFLYQQGSIYNLGALNGRYSEARAINDRGQVVGRTQPSGSGFLHAFIYTDGVMQDMGTLPGTVNSIAYGINENRQVVGGCDTNRFHYAFVYLDGVMSDIGKLGTITNSTAYGISSSGIIVGESQSQSGSMHAFRCANGSMEDLNALVGNQIPGFTLRTAYAINDMGQIVGIATNGSGQYHAFLLNPLPDGWKEKVTTTPPQMVYGNYSVKGAGKDSLVLITHGWQPFPLLKDVAWVDTMSNAVSAYLENNGMNNWQVYGYKWEDNAWKFNPSDALANGMKEGQGLGNSIALQGWTHVHLIAHSAGAGLIQIATEVIKNYNPSTVVHETFLDPFVGHDSAGVIVYGRRANWADQYFTRDKETERDLFASLFSISAYTESPVYHSYNVDVTGLDSHKSSHIKFVSSASGAQVVETCLETETSHGWPIEFYLNTIVGNLSSVYAGSDYGNFGWPLSEEGGDWNDVVDLPRGNGTDIEPTIPTKVLGTPDIVCSITGQLSPQPFWDTKPDPAHVPSEDSATGTIEKLASSIVLHTGSPVWTAMFITLTNPVNFVSFDAKFISMIAAQGMLSVYWDTNIIGNVDERVVQEGLQHYMFTFPNATVNSTHVLGLRLDPFSNVQSGILLTNIVLNQVGISQPFSLSVTTNVVNGLRVLRLDGEPGFNYYIQASTDLTNANWTDVAVLANTNGTVFFYDPDSLSYAQRFYRAIAP